MGGGGGGGGMFSPAGPVAFGGVQPGLGLNSGGFNPGDRVFEPDYGEGTVETFVIGGDWAGKLKVKFDKDGFAYHVSPATCRKLGGMTAPDIGAEALKAIQNFNDPVAQEFNPGDRVSDPNYGEGTVETFITSGDWAGRLKVKFDGDGFSYHVEPTTCRKLGGATAPNIGPEALKLTPSVNENSDTASVLIPGDRVFEPEYGDGTVEVFLTSGDWAGKLKVKFDRDGFAYHVDPSNCKKLGGLAAPAPPPLGPAPFDSPTFSGASCAGEASVTPEAGCGLNVGDRIFESDHGEGTVETFVTSGDWAGKLKVKFNKDGFSYHVAPDQCNKIGHADDLGIGEPPVKMQKIEDVPVMQKTDDVPFVS